MTELTYRQITATIRKECLDGPSEDVRKADASMADRIAAQFRYLTLRNRQADPLLSEAQAFAKAAHSPEGEVLMIWEHGPYARFTLEKFIAAHNDEGFMDTLVYQIHVGWHGGVGTPGLDDLRKFQKQDRAGGMNEDTPPRAHPGERDEALAAFRNLVDNAMKALHGSAGPGLSRDEVMLRLLRMSAEAKAAAARIVALPAATND